MTSPVNPDYPIKAELHHNLRAAQQALENLNKKLASTKASIWNLGRNKNIDQLAFNIDELIQYANQAIDTNDISTFLIKLETFSAIYQKRPELSFAKKFLAALGILTLSAVMGTLGGLAAGVSGAVAGAIIGLGLGGAITMFVRDIPTQSKTHPEHQIRFFSSEIIDSTNTFVDGLKNIVSPEVTAAFESDDDQAAANFN